MKKIRKMAGLLFSFMAAAVLLSGCGSGNTGKTEVRVGYFPNITHTQALVMKNQRTLENLWGDSCEVTWTSFNAGPEEIEAFFAGELDLGYIGPVPAVNANVKSNGDVKIISNSTNAGAVLLKRKDAGIEDISDLAGKKAAVPQLGNTQHLCLLNLLEENNLATTDQGGDVTIVASSNADILNLMDNGSVDAALVPEPWGTTIENSGNAEILLDYQDIFLEGNYPTAVVVARSEFMEEHPDLVEDFLKAHEDATLLINENGEEAQGIVNTEIQKVTGKTLEEDVIRSAFSRMTVTTELNPDAIMEFARISEREGFINQVPEENDVFTAEGN
ncbi:MAG: aliphatic sulfonate ABC transporter substrate-binding protein [Clostridiales bacterium]|nr:aliphatic sulfonate ABC transporter substrate-binding protein [Clostridiales bacterium]